MTSTLGAWKVDVKLTLGIVPKPFNADLTALVYNNLDDLDPRGLPEKLPIKLKQNAVIHLVDYLKNDFNPAALADIVKKVTVKLICTPENKKKSKGYSLVKLQLKASNEQGKKWSQLLCFDADVLKKCGDLVPSIKMCPQKGKNKH